MSYKEQIKQFAETLATDDVTNTPNRLDIPPELWDKGWLREVPVAAQHLNTLMYLLSSAIKEETLSPENNLLDVEDIPTARDNLGTFDISKNLSDVVDKTAARDNLDTYRKSYNLSDIPNANIARTNLGVNTKEEILDAVYPVGSIYSVTGVSTNPATLLGIGTWSVFGAGRVPIGVGTGSLDANGESLSISDGTQGGEVNHTLTEEEIPSHTHRVLGQTSGSSNTQTVVDNYIAGDTGSNHTYTNSGDNGDQLIESTGGSESHTNVQPWIAVRMWRRTA